MKLSYWQYATAAIARVHGQVPKPKHPSPKSYTASLRDKARFKLTRLGNINHSTQNLKTHTASLRRKAGFKFTWPRLRTTKPKPTASLKDKASFKLAWPRPRSKAPKPYIVLSIAKKQSGLQAARMQMRLGSSARIFVGRLGSKKKIFVRRLGLSARVSVRCLGLSARVCGFFHPAQRPNPKSEFQSPNSKRKISYIQIAISEFQNPKPRIQTPKSKIPYTKS